MQFTSSTANVSENNKVAKGKASTSTIDARTSGNGGEIITLQFGPESNWAARTFWELQDEIIRPYGRGANIQAHPTSSIIDRGVHFGGDVSKDKEFPRAMLFDVRAEHNLVDLMRPMDRDVTGRGVIFDNNNNSNMMMNGGGYQQVDLNSYNFFQENVQAAIETSMNSWGGAMQRFDIGGTPYQHTNQRQQQQQQQQNNMMDPEKIKKAIESSRPPSKWSDGWRPKFHRKSIYEIPNVTNTTPFDVWSYGYEVMSSTEEADLYLDGLRFQLEHCDRVQGFQVFVDIDSGFGGFCEKFLEEVKEECRSSCIITYGLTPKKWGEGLNSKSANYSYISSNVANRQSKRNINVGIAMAQLTSLSTLYLPLSLGGSWESVVTRYLNYDSQINHHRYCMLGLAIDSMTLPFRKTTRTQFEFTRACTTIANRNARRNVASLSLSCPIRGQTNVLMKTNNNSNSNSFINMKTVTKNLYIDGDYGSIERYGNVRRDDSEMKRMTMDFNQYLTNAPPVEKWSEKNNMLSFSPECVVSEEVKTLKSNEEEEGLSYKKERKPLTYGMMGTVRGIVDKEYPSLPCEVLLLKQLSRTRCDPRRIIGFSNKCPTIVPKRFYPRDITMERDDTGYNSNDNNNSGIVESKQGQSNNNNNGEVIDDKDDEHKYERFLSTLAVVRSSSDLVPMLQGTLAGLKSRPQKIMFEYVKGQGLTNDDIVEMEQSLFQIVEAYMED